MLGTISDYCSILGFLITILTFGYAFLIERRIKQFEKSVLFNTRVPILLEDLKHHNSQFSKNLKERRERSIRESLNLCRTVLEAIYPKLPNDLEQLCIKANKRLKDQYKSNFRFENTKIKNWYWVKVTILDDLWESYDNLNSLIIHIEERQSDKKII